jgi:hypothetical protein
MSVPRGTLIFKNKFMSLYITEEQTKYLLKFFKNEEFPGWEIIAKTLIEKGKCVVAGENCIWRGGISNFIVTKKAFDFFGCLEYHFDLEPFLKSEFFKQYVNNDLDNLLEEQKLFNEKVTEISNLHRFANK